MPVVVDTTVLPADERFDAWAEASLRVFEPITVRPRTRRPFDGKLVRRELGPLQVLYLAADASAARRTRALIQASDPESVQLMMQVRGACAITQEDRSATIRRGDLGAWHSSSPYVVESDGPFQIVIVTCPSSLFARHADRVRRRTAQRIDGTVGVGHLVRAHLSALRRVLELDACSEDARSHLAEGLFDLVRALHASEEPPPPSRRRGSGQLRAQVDRYIEANLVRQQLDRATIARENFISCSYLDRLYRGEDLGVAGVIREKRLDNARHELADRACAEETVFAIASRWRFVSPSHFSRVFRAAYGQSPSEYREAALARQR